MIHVVPKIPAYISFRALGAPKLLPFNLTVSVSYDCNSKCKTCNIWKKHAQDLTLEEYEKIFKKFGKVFWVTLSGGEPFLRKDLDQIALLLYKHCKPKIINIPTNGLLGPYIAKKAEEIARACPHSEIVLNLSLDGIGKQHDEIRGIPGNFQRSMQTYEALRKIKLRNFSLGIHTVISKFNVNDIPEICDYVLDKLKPDSYISEVAEERVELDSIGTKITPTAQEYTKAVDYLSKKTSKTKTKGLSRFTLAFRSGYYEFAKKVLSTKKQAIPCYAGVASAQISPEGDVWGCCVRAEPLGNLRNADYDFRKIWFDVKADKFRKSVKDKECACPLANAYYSSAIMDPVTLAKVSKKVI
ncbi:Coenzyme PQQ synthesis protein E [Candidatus Bilamarchaeum dharawalense]|uniref:Coenzyme PQQ synthesis protein E n=1 Tax=Candidatus Bilamarchaeum dharawalense TaxID=2885759 RepID=A0A5E4LSA2_9ARCH|nr:Coenzyme PQQ synthesis protein E [Candidatus Bilamarchaeum dharawalense]